MKIPKRFKLFGQTIDVVFDPTLTHEKDWNGAASYRNGCIKLQPDSPQTPRKPQMIEQTFCHELAHYLFYAAGAKKGGEWLHQDEDLVEMVGCLLHQALTTMEFE